MMSTASRIILLNKESGVTSFTALNKVKKTFDGKSATPDPGQVCPGFIDCPHRGDDQAQPALFLDGQELSGAYSLWQRNRHPRSGGKVIATERSPLSKPSGKRYKALMERCFKHPRSTPRFTSEASGRALWPEKEACRIGKPTDSD